MATPTSYTPTVTRVSNLATTAIVDNSSAGTQYTNASALGAKVESIIVVNKTTTAVTVRVGTNNNTTTWYVAYDVSIPPNGLPVELLQRPIYVANADRIKASAGTATALDLTISTIEMA